MTAGAKSGPSHWRLYSLIGLMTFLWSVNYVVAKIALRELPPLFTVGARTALAGLLILPVYFWHSRRTGRPQFARSDVPGLLALGLLGVSLNQLLFVIGIGKTTVAHAAIVIALSPILVLLMATLMGLERLKPARVIGMLVALTGVLVLQFARGSGTGGSWVGDLLIFSAGFSFAVFTVMGKRVTRNFHSITMNTFAYVAGGIVLLPLALWSARSMSFANVSWVAWTSIVYMAVFPSVLCYLIYYYALTHVPASRISAFAYLQPLIATTVAIPMLGEHPTTSLALGGALVLTGVVVTERL